MLSSICSTWAKSNSNLQYYPENKNKWTWWFIKGLIHIKNNDMRYSLKLTNHQLNITDDTKSILEKFERNRNIIFRDDWSNQISNK